MLKNSIIVLLLFAFIPLYSQKNKLQQEQNLDKYWFYRAKLKNDFLVIGADQGNSIPISIRNRWGGDEATWGDATIYLGWYLGVLATENFLLGQQNDKKGKRANLQELYYAMNALQRLDKIAEYHSFNKNGTQSNLQSNISKNPPNGFISRDDIPEDFVQKYSDELNSSKTAEKKIIFSKSDWMKKNRNYEMSKDQVIHMLMGLKLVWKYLPDREEQIKIDDEQLSINFKNWAGLLSLQMLDYSISNSKIDNPITKKLVKRGGLTKDVVYPLSKLSQEYINASESRYNSFKKRRKKKFSASYVIWAGYKKMCHLKVDNLHMVMTLGSITNNTISRKKIVKKANHQNWSPFYELLFDVLHNQPKKIYQQAFGFLSAAPEEGVAHKMPSIKKDDNIEVGWESPHRFIKSAIDQNIGWAPSREKPNETMIGYFNGLDYMLLYNLYRINSIRSTIEY